MLKLAIKISKLYPGMRAVHISQGGNTKWEAVSYTLVVAAVRDYYLKNGGKLNDKNVFKGKKKKKVCISAGSLNEDNLWYKILLSLLIHTEVCTMSDVSDWLDQHILMV